MIMLDLDLCPAETLFPRRRSLRQELSARTGLREIRVAVLSGSTTEQFVAVLELLLLHSGFRPTFFQGSYGRFYEEAVLDTAALQAFEPEIVYLHTSSRNLRRQRPPADCSEEALAGYVDSELGWWAGIWNAVEGAVSGYVIQNNFELPPLAGMGNLSATAAGGVGRYVGLLNAGLAEQAAKRPKLLVQDVAGVAARVGLNRWYDMERFFSYKILHTAEAQLELARSLAAMLRAAFGMSRKVLVLDLDNTLWGGVIGEDGVGKIALGRETPQAEAYTAFQEYCLLLRERGVVLAVCSKNDDAVARSGFAHPDAVLKLQHFAAFKANWLPKHENLETIARELNLGIDSFVFVDDNPAEREIVRAQLPMVAVPEVGKDVTQYPFVLEQARYFEPAALSREDFARAEQYAANAERSAQTAKFADYGEYLASLEMQAEIAEFAPVYMDRIAQLTNKTNQFNLTTRRYALPEIEAMARDPKYVTLYGRLTDKFGDNGLVSVVAARQDGIALEIELWLMSCRVLKRDMEFAMLQVMVEKAKERGVRRIVGTYLPTAKNSMVAGLYPAFGFRVVAVSPELPEGATRWELMVDEYVPRNLPISLLELAHA